MAYEIPKNLKYEEKILFNLTIWQALWLGFFSVIFIIVFTKIQIFFEAKVLIGVFLSIIAAGFAFFDLKKHLKTAIGFLRQPRQLGYLDKKMSAFLEVTKIENDSFYLKDGAAKAIIQVQPINFHILSTKHQQAIISAFKDFLNSLDFSIQIVVRTVNLSLEDYLQKLEQKVRLQKNEKLLVQFSEFQEFMREYIEKNAIKNRIFYIVVPCEAKRFAKKIENQNQLDIRVKICMDKLKNSNLATKRLTTNELVSLLSTYFEGFIEVENEYQSLLTILERRQKA